MNALLITALLIVTEPGQPPENLAAFFSHDGPEMCQALARALNEDHPPELYVCQTEGNENVATHSSYRGKDPVQSSYRF